jgi:phosphatidylserine/phosphatidylglycerophosphate/cardiolipin synthase-like enzyme
MDTSIYSSRELREFQEIMDSAIEEAAQRGLDMPLAIMARRLFDAAQGGERSREKLKEAALEAKVIQLRAYGRAVAPDRKTV